MDAFKPTVLSYKTSTHTLSLHILPFGLTLHRLVLSSNSDPSKVQDLLVGPETPKDHQTLGRSFFGPIVGRFANRLPSGESTYGEGEGERKLDNHGMVHLLEWSGPSISHHGGPSTETPSPSTSILQSGPFDRCIFQPLEVSQSQLFKSTSSNSTSSQIFAIESPADDNGYPGKIRVEVLIRVLPPTNSSEKSSKGRISILYRTKLLDSKVISTPINLTHHWGFNLSETSPETGIKNVDSHELEILPSKTTPHSNEVQLLEMSNTTNLPTGKFSSTKATSHDFQKVRKIKDEKKGNQDFPEGGFDHFYIFGPPSKSTSKSTSISDLESSLETSRSSQPPSTILSCPSSKTTLTFKTNQSGVQLYTANGQPPFPAPSNAGGSRKLLHQSEKEKKGVGHGNGERSAAFLEFSHPHGNFLHESLREISGSSTLVKGHWEEKEIVENENWVEVEVWKGE